MLNTFPVNLSPLSDEDDDVALLTVEPEPGVFAISYVLHFIFKISEYWHIQ